MKDPNSAEELRRMLPDVALSLETANLLVELESISDIQWSLGGTDGNPHIDVVLDERHLMRLRPLSQTGSDTRTWGKFSNLQGFLSSFTQHLRVKVAIQVDNCISTMFTVEAFSLEAVISKVRLAMRDS